jgi:hypothetical protein
MLFQKPGDSLLQLRLSFCSPVSGELPVNIPDVAGTIPDAEAELTCSQLVILLDAKPFRPSPIDKKIVLAL